MAIVKMEMVNILGLTDDFSRIVFDYLSENNIHPENDFSILEDIDGIYPYAEERNLFDEKNQAAALLELAGINEEEIISSDKYKEYRSNAAEKTEEEILNELKEIGASILPLENEKNKMYDKLKEYNEIRKQLYPIETADVNLNRLFEFEFIKLRFGKMPVKSYKIMYEYLTDMDAFFLKTSEDREYVWGVYFIPEIESKEVDAVFSSLYFERIRISDNVHGTPEQSLKYLDEREIYRKSRIKELEGEIVKVLSGRAEFLVYAKEFIEKMKGFQKIKKYAGHTKESFYFAGWMASEEVGALSDEMESEQNVIFLKEKPEEVKRVKPPTKLKNLFFIRPFEMFIKMYGLPSYNESDPTWILAVSYFIMFGAMFGDLGQGFVLFAGGFLLAKFRKMAIGNIIGAVGISSMLFGIYYGNIFGMEGLITGYNPMDHIMDVLMRAVYLGIIIILFVMAVNIIIGIKNKDTRKFLFSQNGLAGLIFYAATVLTVLYLMNGRGSISIAAIIVIAAMLLLIFLQEPLSKLAARRKNWMPKKKGMFILESFFELFEIVLSFVTNTLSFLRLGAFALIHVGMMRAVQLLSDMAGGGAASIIIIIVGNIIVIVLEGLVVGIQTLRLEFYEMFNRFYTGNGRAFKSFKEN